MEGSQLEEYKHAAADALQRAKDLLERTDWTVKKEDKEGVVMSDIEVTGHPIKCLKVMGFIPEVDAQQIANELWKFEEKEWKKMESTVKSFEVVEFIDGIGTKAKVCYQVNSLPWPLTDRDTVALW